MNPQALSEQEQEKAKQEIAKAFGIDKKLNVDCNRAEGFFLIDNITHIENGVIIHEGKRLRIDKFDFSLLLKYPLMFFNCDFECAIGDALFYSSDYKTLRFFDCTFKKQVLLGAESLKTMSYQIEKCIFEDRVKIEGIFDKDTFFTNNIFKSSVGFKKSFFQKQVSFYGSTFEQCPNFAQSYFEGNINLVDTNLDFDYESTKQEICKEVENRKNDFKSSQGSKAVANDFRDSFRLFKNTLSKEGNILDASNYHRVELYCKEIELDSKPQKTWRDRIDSLQLWFYRHLCDHHTDLLRAWNSLLCLVFVFGVLSFGAMAWFAYYFDDNFSLANCFNATHLRVFYDSHISFIIHKHPLHILGINLGFIVLFLFLYLSILTLKIFRWIFIIPSYIVTIGMFATSPKLLLPAIGFFTDKREILDPLSIIGGFYTLLFGLLAYSLIKTARKNSIIPS